MLFSAIIPVYNGAKYIKSLAADLQAQSCKDFEAIFINDGSTDDSLAILREVQKNANFAMKIIDQENRGVSAARNAGIKASQGDWITFIDVDDGISAEFFDVIARAVSNNTSDFYIFRYTHSPKGFDNRIKSIRTLKRDTVLVDFLYGRIKSGIWGTAVKKHFLISEDLRFDEKCSYAEDQQMLWQIFAAAAQISLIESTIYLYRINVNSAMRVFPPARFQALETMRALEPVIQQKAPLFYPLYKKYAVARICWSLLWQAAAFLSVQEFVNVYKQNNLSSYIRKLTTFPEIKVKFSALLLLNSPLMFYSLARIYARKRLFDYSDREN